MATDVIKRKRLVNGKIILSEPTMVFVKNIQVIAYHRVEEDEAMRIDRIAEKYYGRYEGYDRILKWNGISNPFTVSPGMILEIPDPLGQTFKWEKPIEIENPIRQQFLDAKRMSKQDAKRLEFLKNRSSKKPNGSKQNLPPNMLKTGEKDVVIKGRVISLQNSSMNTKRAVVGDSAIVKNKASIQVKNIINNIKRK
jgi:hypothetical protein